MASRYVRNFDRRMERLASPQEPIRMRLGKPVTQTGMILPYGRGGYRHTFGNCCGSLGADDGQGMPFMAWVLLLGCGGALAYTLLQSVKS